MKTPRSFFEAIATLTGCTIGAGIFSIPYIVVRAGFWTGALVIVFLGLVILTLHLLLGEIALRTKKPHQLVGFAAKYLGTKGKWLMALSMVIGIYGALTAYTLGVSESLSQLFGLPQWLMAFFFYIACSMLVYGGLAVLEKSELFMEIIKFLIIAVIFVALIGSKYFRPENLTGFSIYNVLMPYGAIFFAYLGTAAIPEVREELRKHAKYMKKAIVIGTLLPLLVYLGFTIAVIGITGGMTTEVATIGVANVLGSWAFVLLHVFAVLAMTTSFIVLGFALRDMYSFDFGISHFSSWALTMIVPICIIAIGTTSFFRTIEITGALAGGLAGALIVVMHNAAVLKGDRKPEYSIKLSAFLKGLLILLFCLGALYVIIGI